MSDLAKSALSMANELHSRDVMRNGCRENCILRQSPEWRAADFLVMAAEHFATLEAKLAKAVEALTVADKWLEDLDVYADPYHDLVPSLQKVRDVYQELTGDDE